MANVFFLQGNWMLFGVGCLGCFCKIFLEYRNSGFIIPTLRQFLFDFVSIIIAGIFTILIQAVTPWQALILGASWDFMFVSALSNQRGEKK